MKPCCPNIALASPFGPLTLNLLVVLLVTGCFPNFDSSKVVWHGDGDGDGDVDGDDATAPGGLCRCDGDCQAVEGHRGICVMGICFTEASDECSRDGSSVECAAGSRCWNDVCWPDCASYHCSGECDNDGSCAPTDASNAICESTCAAHCRSGDGDADGDIDMDADAGGDGDIEMDADAYGDGATDGDADDL